LAGQILAMLTPKTPLDNWQEALKLINRCPICSESYTPEKAKVFAKNETAHLVHITCEKCQSYFVAMILMMGQGLSSVGMVTDLNYEDIRRLNKLPAISTDEAIESYSAIQEERFLHSLIFPGSP